MTGLWLRRAFMAAACASVAFLAGCGSSTTVSALTPARFIVFGDAFSDLGAAGAGRYTVNDGTINNWVQEMAAQYGRTVSSTADGGTGYARGNARVTAAVDAAGGSAPSITAQISNFLASGGAFGPNDVVVINGGISDVIVQVSATVAGSQNSTDMLANAGQAGRDLAAQVRRVVNAGAKFVVVAGTYDLSRTPWGSAAANSSLAAQASGKFNDELLVTIVDLGASVLYVDAAFYYNLVTSSPAGYSFSSLNGVCTSVDPGPGIGTGTGQVNSSLCNTGTLSDANYNAYVFADGVYTTPQAQRLFGDYAYTRMKARF